MSNSNLALIQNASLLLAMAVVFDTTARRWKIGEKTWKRFFLGIVLGGIGIMVMNTPWIYGEGLIFDTRSILLSISGLFFGTIPTLIAMTMTAIYRYTQEGAYLTGILVIVATSLIGIVWRHTGKTPLYDLPWWKLGIFGIVVHVVMLLLMLTQPIKIALPLLSKISLPIMLIYPAGTVLLGLLFVNRLRREKAIEENNSNQSRLKSMVNILQYFEDNSQSFVDLALEEAVNLTESTIGFIFFYSETTKIFTLSSWSKTAMEICEIPNRQTNYELDKTGIWGEPVRQRQPIVINEFQQPHPFKKGYPEGHPKLQRLLEIPVFSDKQIVAVVGVGNKLTEYTDIDITQLTLLMELTWKIIDRKKAVEALRVSEENYRLLFNQAADGIFITSTDGNFVDVNESGCTMLGYTQEEIQTRFKEILQNTEESFDQMAFIDQLSKKSKIVTERKLLTKNNGLIDVEIITQQLPDGRIQKQVRNISERKKAEEVVFQTQNELRALLNTSDETRKALLSVIEDQKIVEEALRQSEKSYRNLFENITQGFALHKIILDEQGIPCDYRFLAANPAYENLTGLKAENIIGKTVKEVLPNVEQSWIDIYGTIALTGISKRFEDYTAAIGKYYDVTAFCPEAGYFAVVISDITERKKYEKEIQDFNSELEARVKQRTAELESANQELESFSYSVSHDLRAPLRSINGFSKIILDEYKEIFNPEVTHYFDLIQKNATIMGNLVDDLLNFSRLGRQPLKKVMIEPAILVHEVIEIMEAEIKSRNIQIEIGELPKCEADPALMRQVFSNLIANSIKFTRNRTDPKIEIGYMAECHNTTVVDLPSRIACYYIKDNGIGFDMKYYDKLFRVFQRLHRAEDYEGTGVGLAIVERIIGKHDGKIWAESVVEQGTTFYFTLGEPKNGK